MENSLVCLLFTNENVLFLYWVLWVSEMSSINPAKYFNKETLFILN